MIDILKFIRKNFNTENGDIVMFDVPASRFDEFNTLFGTSFQGVEGIIRIRIGVNDFISHYIDVFRNIGDRHSSYDVLMKLLYYDERKRIGNAPFFRYKIFESLRTRSSKVRLFGQKPDRELPVSQHKVQPFMPHLR